MFGIKLRSWMEAHIVRPRKKRSKEAKGGKGGKATPVLPDPPAKSALADPTLTAAHSASSPATSTAPVKRVTLVSPTPSSRVSHGENGGGGLFWRRGHTKLADDAGSSSPRRPPPPLPTGAHQRGGRPNSPRGASSGPRYSTYLSSPESAYSTGYSTDATSPHGYSPGTSLPPEYYINLRTGTRYFQSAERQQQQQLQQLQQHQNGGDVAQASTSSGRSDEEESRAQREQRVRFGHQRTLSTAGVLPQQHHHPYCRHTVAKVSSVTLEDGGYSYGAPVPPRHRRTESADASHSCEATSRPHPHVTIRTSFAQVEEVSVCGKRSSLIQQQQTPTLGCNSPRQRSRIRTNPWMSSGTTGSSSTAGTDKLQWTTSSSCSDIAPTPLTEDISTAATIGSWRRDDGHTTTTTTADEESAAEEVTAFRRPSRRRRTSQDAERKGDGVILSPAAARRGSLSSNSTLSSSPSSTPRRSSPSSGGHVEDDEDEDLTLNEIGRFDESYVYEKETDILSDSDPTDCEEEGEGEDNDYNNGNLTDRHSSSDFLDMSYQNGINNSSSLLKTDFDEDELDFIDNGPLDTSCELPSTTRINTGHCTYYHNNFIDINNRHSLNNNNNNNKNITRPSSINNKRPSRRRAGDSGKRQSGVRKDQDTASPVRRVSQRKGDSSRRSVSCGSRRGNHRPREVRVLAEAEVSSGPVTPAVSSSSTPVAARRKGVENGGEVDRRSAIPGSRYLAAFPSEVRLIEADKEADRKYQELILEAETLLVHMKSSSVEEEEVEPETPTVENPPRPFPPTRPNTASLHLQVVEPHTPASGSADAPPPRQVQQSVVAIQVTTPSGGPPRALVTFRSVDLSSPVAAEAPYCPQSEPLKRKVYTSAALQRLQQHLALAECAESSDSPPDDDEHSAQDRLGAKVAELRRERLAAEARLASREEERRKRRERAKATQELALVRRNTLLQTLESLKRDLQTQSASLHDSYSSITDLRSPSAADAQRNITTPSRGQPAMAGTEKPRCDFLSPIRRASSLRSPTAPKPPPRRC